ncbi:hypothetical protein GCM10027091_27440 [Streptomyces daliensis]
MITDVVTTAAATHDSQVLPGILTHRGPADRGPVHQEPVPLLPRPCSVRSHCTSTADSARTVGFPLELRDL